MTAVKSWTLQDSSDLWFNSQTHNVHTPTDTQFPFLVKSLTTLFFNHIILHYFSTSTLAPGKISWKAKRDSSVVSNYITHTHTNTCLCGCFGLRCSCRSFPLIFLLSLCLNPRAQQPLGDGAPTLPTSPIPSLTWVSQLAARAWSKAADWCHKTGKGPGERKTRADAERGGRSRVCLPSCFSGWQKTSKENTTESTHS